MKIAFLGGTRFIGPHAIALAAQRGHSVSVLHRGNHRCALPDGVEEMIVDREDEGALSHALRKVGADVVVDTFAMTGPQADRAIRSMQDAVGSVVVLSSQDVYAQFGRLNGHPCSVIEEKVTEDSPLTVSFPFRGIAEHEGGGEYDKKDVERAFAQAAGPVFESTTILRLPAVYGSGDYQYRFRAIVERLDSRAPTMPCQNDAQWRWTHGHARNIAAGIVLAAETRLSGYQIFNLGEAAAPTMRERVERIASILGVSFKWEVVESIPAGVRDPSGIPWETYQTMADAEIFKAEAPDTDSESPCCG